MAGGCGAGSRGLKFKKRLEIFIAINNHAAIDLSPSVCLVHHHHPPQSSKPCTLGRNLMTSSPSTRRCGTCHNLAPANSHSASRNRTALADTTRCPFKVNATHPLAGERVTAFGIEEGNNCTGVRPVEGSASSRQDSLQRHRQGNNPSDDPRCCCT